MQKTKIATFSFLALFAVIVMSGCKNRTDLGDIDTVTSQDHALVEGESNSLIEMMEHEIDENGINKVEDTWLPTCATVSWDTVNDPHSFAIDFGSQNCLCSNWDGKERRGTITLTWTGRYRDAGTVITWATDDYYVNDNEFNFQKSVTNNGTNPNGEATFTVNVEEASVTLEDGSTISWVSTRTRTWKEGASTVFNPFDDVYEVTGTASGVNRNGRAFEVEITKALRVQLNCWWVTEGTIEIRPQDLETRILDYGDGTCDATATVMVGDRSQEILLR